MPSCKIKNETKKKQNENWSKNRVSSAVLSVFYFKARTTRNNNNKFRLNCKFEIVVQTLLEKCFYFFFICFQLFTISSIYTKQIQWYFNQKKND